MLLKDSKKNVDQKDEKCWHIVAHEHLRKLGHEEHCAPEIGILAMSKIINGVERTVMEGKFSRRKGLREDVEVDTGH